MVWHSVPLMTGVDIFVLLIGAVAATRIYRSRKSVGGIRIISTQIFIGLGLFTIIAFFASDLMTMWVLPSIIGNAAATSAMETLHLEISWFAFPISVGAISYGLLTQNSSLHDALQQTTESENRVGDFAELGADWFWELDHQLRFTYISENIARFGKGPDFFMGKTVTELAPDGENGDEKSVGWADELRALREHRPYRNIEKSSATGVSKWVRSSGIPIFDKGGAFIGYRGVTSDITDQKLAEQEKHESDENFRRLIEGAPQGFVIHDQLRPVFTNAALADILKYDSPEDVLAFGSLQELWAPHERERVLGYYAARRAGEPAPSQYDLDGLCKDGTIIPLHLSAQTVHWQGRPHVAAMIVDMSDRQRAEVALRESNERYRNLSEGSLQGILVHRDLKPLYANDAFCRIFGFTSIEDVLLLPSIEQLAHNDDQERVRSRAHMRAAGEDISTLTQLRGRRIDGTEIWFETMGRTIQWDGDDAIQATIMDITERKRAEEDLRESELRYRTLTEGSLQGIGIVQDDRIAFVNNSFAELLGYVPKEMLGRAVNDFVLPEYRQLLTRRRNDRMDGGRPRPQYDFQALHRDGSGIWVQQLVQPINWRGRAAVQVSIIDLTQRKAAETAMVQAKDEAEKANRAKTEFLAHFSHELRTPLNAILGFSEVMQSELFGPMGHEKYAEYAQDIHQSGGFLLSLITDIIDLSRIEAGQLELDEQVFDAGAIMKDCARQLRDRAGAKGVRIDLRLPGSVPRLTADERKVRQILLNLLSNAVKFTRPDTIVTFAVEIGADGALLFRIADAGKGISETDLERAQEPFVRLEGALTSSEEGAGLGLAITKLLIESHGGSLTLSSKIDQGTTAVVSFPAHRVS